MKTRSAPGRAVTGVVVPLLFSLAAWSAAADEYLWIAAPGAIYRVETNTGVATRLPFEPTGVVDLALDARRDRIWILQVGGRVAVHRLDGSEIRVFTLDEARDDGGAASAGSDRTASGAIAVNPTSGDAYAAWQGGLHYLNADTKTRAVIYLPETIRGTVADPAGERIWAATSRGIYAFDANGERVRSIEVDEGFAVLDLALNPAAETLLLVIDDASRSARVLRELNADGGVTFETWLRDLSTVTADGSGGFWATGRKNVLHFSDAHRLQCAFAVRRARSSAMATAANSVNGSIWLATEARILRVDDNCAITRQFAKTDIDVAAMLFEAADTPPFDLIAP